MARVVRGGRLRRHQGVLFQDSNEFVAEKQEPEGGGQVSAHQLHRGLRGDRDRAVYEGPGLECCRGPGIDCKVERRAKGPKYSCVSGFVSSS